MKLRSLFLVPFLALAATGCVSGSASEPITITNTINVDSEAFLSRPNAKPLLVETYDYSYPVDVSSALSKLDKYGNLNVVVNQNSITGDISFVSHIYIALESVSQPTALVVCDSDVSTSSTTNSFPVLATGAELLAYLADSSATLDFQITGTVPTTAETLVSNISLTVSDSVSKSL